MTQQLNIPKTPDSSTGTARLLTERLRELNINPSGLPPHVLTRLRAEVETEAERIHCGFVSAVADLQRKADDQTKKAIARIVTFKTVGKAFTLPTSNPAGGAAK